MAVCKALLDRGDAMVYFPKVLEILGEVHRLGEFKSDTEIVEYVAKQIERKENKWLWLQDHEKL